MLRAVAIALVVAAVGAFAAPGDLVWNYTMASGITNAGNIAATEDLVVIGTSSGLIALNAASGATKWTVVGNYGPAAFIPNGSVVVAPAMQAIIAVRAADGSRIFTTNMVLPRTDIAPVITADGAAAVYFTHSGYASGILLATGRPAWIAPTVKCTDTLSRITAESTGSTVYVSCSEGGLFALDGLTGAVLWSKPSLPTVYHVVPTSVGILATLEMIPGTGELTVNATGVVSATGAKAWTQSLSGAWGFVSPTPGPSFSSVIFPSWYRYNGDTWTNVYADVIDMANGQIIGSGETDEWDYSSGIAIGTNSTWVMGDYQGVSAMYCGEYPNLNDCFPTWSLNMPNYVDQTPFIVDGGKATIAADLSGNVVRVSLV